MNLPMKQLTCRNHGGTFMVVSARGRPPVKCTESNPCTAHPNHRSITATQRRVTAAAGITTVERTASTIKNARSAVDDLDGMTARELREYALKIGASSITKLTKASELRSALRRYIAHRNELTERDAAVVSVAHAPRKISVEPVFKAPEAPVKATIIKPTVVTVNPCAALATAAKEQLESLGWSIKGRVWRDEVCTWAELTAARGEELITITWKDGALLAQNYMLWNCDQPHKNNAPVHKLKFDPDEMSDKEIVRAISGMKVTWWNRLGNSEETAVVPADKIKIEHNYNGHGDETPGDRIVTLCDRNAGGFRSFRLGALLKIG